MLDLNNMTEDELEVLTGIAKAKGLTVEEVLKDMGHDLPKAADEPDDVVELSGGTGAEDPPVRTISFGTEPKDAEELPKMPETASAVELPPPAEEESEPEQPEEEKPEEADSTLNVVCTHCGWDQSVPVLEEPSSSEKLSFLQSVLGAVPFKKKMSMFGGHLTVTFRTLTIKEIDKLYVSAFEAQQSGQIKTASDYYEYINRLRMHLQILSVKGRSVPLQHDLPDGLDQQSNSKASHWWEDFLKEKGSYDENRSLAVQVQDYVVGNILITEQLLRVVSFECQKFNRLAAQLEARVDDSDFWKETEQLS